MVRMYYGYCPLGERCKKGNKVMCKKETRAEALASIQNHLRSSPYHTGITENGMKDLMKEANMEICVWSEDEDGKGREIIEGSQGPEGEAARREARERKEAEREERRRKQEEDEERRREDSERRRKEAEREERRRKQEDQERHEGGRGEKRQRRHGDEAEATGAIMVVPRGASSSSNDIVHVPRQELQGIYESLVRAQRSCQHAARMATAAAQAFESEGTNLEHCKIVVERALMRQ